MIMNEDEKVIREYIINDSYTSFFVEAGAGAGKTHLIVKRIVKQLENGIKPENIVVITFTNMAAEELRDRIAKEVLEKCADNPSMKDVDIDLMQISTIHSFCYRLIKERCFDAGLPFNVKLIEEEQDYQLQERLFHQYTQSWTKDDRELLDNLGYDKRRDYISRINSLYMELNRLPSDVHMVIPEIRQSDMKDELRKIEELRLSFIKLIKNCAGKIADGETLKDGAPDNSQTNTYKVSVSFKESNISKAGKDIYDKAWSAYYDEKKEESEIISRQLDFLGSLKCRAMGTFFLKPKGKGKDDLKKIVGDCNDEMSDWLNDDRIKIIDKYVNRLNSPRHIIICNYARKAHEYYIANRPDNMINNNQVIETASNLIKDNEDARKYFADKFTDIYVDEFQDTDHIQENLIWCLGRKARLFLVGDPKQSIYRFRGAEPAVYFQTKEKMKSRENTKVCELSYNYRSNPEIIDWVNKQFAKKKDMIIDGNYIPMEAVKQLVPQDTIKNDNTTDIIGNRKDNGENNSENNCKECSKLILGVYVNKFPGYESSDNYGKNNTVSKCGDSDIENDSEAVSKLIYQLVNSDYLITDYTNDESHKPYARRIKYSDIMVLCRNKNHMDIYLNKMKEKGIPVNFAGRYIMNDEMAVVIYVKMYRYLSAPWINESKVAAQEALYASNIGEPQNILLLMWEETKDMTAYGIAEYLLNHIGDILNKCMISKMNKDCNNENQEEDQNQNENNDDKSVITIKDMNHIMSRLHQLVESVYVDCDGDSQQFADELEKKAACESERTLSLRLNANEVSFMNLHKAKGLEANIVILACRDDNNGFKGGAITIGNNYYPVISGAYSYAKPEWQSYDNDSEQCIQACKEENSETYRLEYVAVTRAAQAFIIMDRIKEGSLFGSGYDYPDRSVKYIIDGYNKLADDENDNNQANSEHDNIFNINQIVNDEENTCIKLISEKNYTGNRIVTKSLSPSDCESTSLTARACMKIWNENERTKTRLEEERSSGAVLGTMMHRALELIVNIVGRSEDRTDMKKMREIYNICSIQAVNESLDKLDDSEPDVNETLDKTTGLEKTDKYRKFIYSVLSAFWDWVLEQGIFENVQNIYTELPFSYMEGTADVNSESGMENAADINSESGMENAANINSESGTESAADINDQYDIDNEEKSEYSWVNGSMDLLIHYKDGSYLLIDYKSDTDYYMNNQEFETALSERYIGQLKMYVKSIKRLYGDSTHVNVGIVSFTQKNCKEGVDVRYTKMDV